MTKPEISVVCPVYGCRDCLVSLTEAVRSTMDAASLTWELVLIDDRAPDAPWSLIAQLAQEDVRVRGVRLARNHGQQLAIWAGLEAARGSWIVVIDCDLQDDPLIIPKLHCEATRSDVHAVIVDRGEWSDSRFRRWASDVFYRLIAILSGIRLQNVGNFGIYSRPMVEMLLRFEEQEVFLPIMVSLTGLKTVTVSVDRSDRLAGKSAYSFRRLLRLATSIIIRFSDRPLKISASLGLVFSTFAGFASLYLLARSIIGDFTVPGWASLVLSVWFLSGIIMLCLGIHGLYLSRVFAEVRRRPRMTIECSTFPPSPEDN